MLRTGFTSVNLPEQGATIHMTTANGMLTSTTSDKLKEAIISVGGRVNYQVK